MSKFDKTYKINMSCVVFLSAFCVVFLSAVHFAGDTKEYISRAIRAPDVVSVDSEHAQ